MSKEYFIVRKIILEGNKVTKPWIILRELAFKENDSIPASHLKKTFKTSRSNLVNTQLFNFIEVDTIFNDGKFVDVRVKVTERWYTFPIPLFELADRNLNSWLQDKNFSRIDFGMMLIRNNFRGRKENVFALVRLGYNEQYRLSYNVPYLDKKQRFGLGFTGKYSRNHEIAYKSFNNKLERYKDSDNYVRKEIEFSVTGSMRQGLFNNHYIDLEYNYSSVEDTIPRLNADYFVKDDNTIRYLELTYTFNREFRDSKVYPLKGYYFDLEITKIGLGIIKGEETNVANIKAMYKRYWKLSSRWFVASSLKTKLSSLSPQPYYVQRGLGYLFDFVRGYENYVIDGQHYGLFKSNLKFAILPTRVFNIKYIKSEKFNPIPVAIYTNAYFDAGYVADNQFYVGNPLSNAILPGFGLGVDFVTYYDRVFRLDYSINKFGERGFYFHFSAPL